MRFQTLIPIASRLGPAICLVIAATSAALPKDVTCHIKVKTDGKERLDKLSERRDGLVTWEENEDFTSIDCGETKWLPTKERCSGFAESDGKTATTTGYCVDVDSDGGRQDRLENSPADRSALYNDCKRFQRTVDGEREVQRRVRHNQLSVQLWRNVRGL